MDTHPYPDLINDTAWHSGWSVEETQGFVGVYQGYVAARVRSHEQVTHSVYTLLETEKNAVVQRGCEITMGLLHHDKKTTGFIEDIVEVLTKIVSHLELGRGQMVSEATHYDSQITQNLAIGQVELAEQTRETGVGAINENGQELESFIKNQLNSLHIPTYEPIASVPGEAGIQLATNRAILQHHLGMQQQGFTHHHPKVQVTNPVLIDIDNTVQHLCHELAKEAKHHLGEHSILGKALLAENENIEHDIHNRHSHINDIATHGQQHLTFTKQPTHPYSPHEHRAPLGQHVDPDSLKQLGVVEGNHRDTPLIDKSFEKIDPYHKYDLGPYTHHGDKTYIWTGDTHEGIQMVTLDKNGHVEHVESSPLKSPDGYRQLPTGMVEAHGHSYLFTSQVNYHGHHDNGLNFPYTTKDTTVFDVTNPHHPIELGKLTGREQISAAFDPDTNKLVFAGNPYESPRDRHLWTVPFDPSTPQAAFNPTNWHNVGNGAAILNDARENQISRLPGGGFLLLSAGDGHVNAHYGDTVEQLHHIASLNPTPLIAGADRPLKTDALLPDISKLSAPYGPEIVSTVMNPNGTRTVTFNVSQWPEPHSGSFAKDIYRNVQYQITVR